MRPWSVFMRWHELLFMHWPVPAESLRRLIPDGLELDTFEGLAWIGVVPFRMSKVRHRLAPAIPKISAFPELNVRPYVTHKGRAGVWFFSLDAASRLAVRGARFSFHLPYFNARMSCRNDNGTIRYSSTRTHRGAPSCEFRAHYRPIGEAQVAAAGSLDDFLTNRLSLFSADRVGRIYRSDIAHDPWPLQPARAEIEINTMTDPLGVELPAVRPLLLYSHTLDVKAWRLERV